MHHAPRFGHSNRLGQVASTNPADGMDYASGLKQFSLFILIPFVFWGILLLIFKCGYGVEKVGCAAGGEVLDMKELSSKGVSRRERKRRILRSWRLQTTFLIVSAVIPTLSLLMMETGWKSIDSAWQEVQMLVDDVEALAFRGWGVVDSLQTTKGRLYKNRLVKELLKQNDTSELFASWCPKAVLQRQGDTNNRLDFFTDAMDTIESNTLSLVQLFDDYVPENEKGFVVMTEITKSAKDSIDWFFSHEWKWKLLIMVLNVLNVLLLLACNIFSRHDIIHAPTRMYLSFVVVPAFTVVTILLLLATASSGVATLLNADFCAGGDEPGSPQGTIQDAILSYQFGSVDRGNSLTGRMGLVYESFNYYSNVRTATLDFGKSRIFCFSSCHVCLRFKLTNFTSFPSSLRVA
jgi:hypothetical protein